MNGDEPGYLFIDGRYLYNLIFVPFSRKCFQSDVEA
jgi:hypothetical protein